MSLIQYGKKSNQPIQLNNVDTFYERQGAITFVFASDRTQVWNFASRTECIEVYNIILQKEVKRYDHYIQS